MTEMKCRTIAGLASMALLSSSPLPATNLVVDGQLESTIGSGTPPLKVSSQSLVPQLNADLLDGVNVSALAQKADLETPGSGTEVHWKNVTNTPGHEISQDCALNAGCFANDDPGFPVTIEASGNYHLVSNLSTNDQDTTLIQVWVEGVEINLNGFALLGPNSCSGTPVTSCTYTATGHGVHVTQYAAQTLIEGGQIKGMGSSAIGCQAPCRSKDLTATENGGGIGTGAGGGLAVNNSATRNGSDGIFGDGVIKNNTSTGNKGDGVSGSGVIKGNYVRDNGQAGIDCSRCVVLDNQSSNNGGYGISLSTHSAYGRNVIHENANGPVNTSKKQLDENYCNGSACP